MKSFNWIENFNPFLSVEKREQDNIRDTDPTAPPAWMSQVFGTLIFDEGEMKKGDPVRVIVLNSSASI